ncbi:MAG: hypothetical protein MUF75_03995 [Bacteroidia bacterium]|nr:hypothetical protein [Bacteroidia bacterium]
MMRYLLILLVILTAFSCLKKKSIGPVPEIEFLEFNYIGPAGYDSAEFKISYIDSDGDLFGEEKNLFVKTLAYNADSAKYVSDWVFSRTIRQPADGFYEGKSIRGYIYLNEFEFRSDARPKDVKFEIFMKDQEGNRSNVVTTPNFIIPE